MEAAYGLGITLTMLMTTILMSYYLFIKGFTTSEDKWFGLDSSAVKIEKVPLVIRPAENIKLKRIYS